MESEGGNYEGRTKGKRRERKEEEGRESRERKEEEGRKRKRQGDEEEGLRKREWRGGEER